MGENHHEKDAASGEDRIGDAQMDVLQRLREEQYINPAENQAGGEEDEPENIAWLV